MLTSKLTFTLATVAGLVATVSSTPVGPHPDLDPIALFQPSEGLEYLHSHDHNGTTLYYFGSSGSAEAPPSPVAAAAPQALRQQRRHVLLLAHHLEAAGVPVAAQLAQGQRRVAAQEPAVRLRHERRAAVLRQLGQRRQRHHPRRPLHGRAEGLRPVHQQLGHQGVRAGAGRAAGLDLHHRVRVQPGDGVQIRRAGWCGDGPGCLWFRGCDAGWRRWL